MRFKFFLLIVFLTAVIGLYFKKTDQKKIAQEQITEDQIIDDVAEKNKVITTKIPTHHQNSPVVNPIQPLQKQVSILQKSVVSKKNNEVKQITFTIDEDVAVTQGDIVLGAPQQDVLKGLTSEPELKLWPNGIIPIYIQPDVTNKDEVRKALSFFTNTSVQFVNRSDEADFIVIQKSAGTCKSYLGKVGGAQPVWIAPDCQATQIAHELMHAIGFVHEQNRTDRDLNIEILWSNIDPLYKLNFEKFSNALMKVTALTNFDFESIMLYPDSMFSINGAPTLRSKVSEHLIRPSPILSTKDIQRINLLYD